MRPFASWDEAGLRRDRMALIVIVAGGAASLGAYVAACHVLGAVSVPLSVAVGALACYTVAGIPKRSLEKSAIIQAREAPVLAASAAIYLQSTGSRAKTILMLKSEESRLGDLLDGVKKATMLGYDLASRPAFGTSDAVRSDAISSILGSVGRAQGERLEDEGEELEGMVRTSLASEESKFPVFLTVSFFLPIMLMLLAAIGHHDDPVSVVSLAFIEIVVLDLALSFSSTERRKLSA